MVALQQLPIARRGPAAGSMLPTPARRVLGTTLTACSSLRDRRTPHCDPKPAGRSLRSVRAGLRGLGQTPSKGREFQDLALDLLLQLGRQGGEQVELGNALDLVDGDSRRVHSSVPADVVVEIGHAKPLVPSLPQDGLEERRRHHHFIRADRWLPAEDNWAGHNPERLCVAQQPPRLRLDLPPDTAIERRCLRRHVAQEERL